MRLLIASSRDWTGLARLPLTFSDAGFDVHLYDRVGSQASSSSRLSGRTEASGTVDEVAAALLQVHTRYDRAIVCDEPLVGALVRSGDPRAEALLPASRSQLPSLLDKTRFPALAEAAGLDMPRSRVAAARADLADAFDDVGPRVVLKARWGFAGLSVREACDLRSAMVAAEELGFPVLVQARVDSIPCLMPCLFERGALVAAFAAQKRETVWRLGPSAVNALVAVDGPLLEMAKRAGEKFGLHGFASFDYFRPDLSRPPVLIEVNVRPVPQLHVGKRAGVDMAGALGRLLSGAFDGTPHISPGPSRGRTIVTLFPQEYRRLRQERGVAAGTLGWLSRPGALYDVPWRDPGLLLRLLVSDARHP